MTSTHISDETDGLCENSSPEERARLENHFVHFIREKTNGSHLREFIDGTVRKVQHFLLTTPNFTAANPIYSSLSSDVSNLSIIEYAVMNNHISRDEATVDARLQELRLYLFRNKFIVLELLQFFEKASIRRMHIPTWCEGIITSKFQQINHDELIKEIRELRQINDAQSDLLIAQANAFKEIRTYIDELTGNVRYIKKVCKKKMWGWF